MSNASSIHIFCHSAEHYQCLSDLYLVFGQSTRLGIIQTHTHTRKGGSPYDAGIPHRWHQPKSDTSTTHLLKLTTPLHKPVFKTAERAEWALARGKTLYRFIVRLVQVKVNCRVCRWVWCHRSRTSDSWVVKPITTYVAGYKLEWHLTFNLYDTSEDFYILIIFLVNAFAENVHSK